MTSSLPIFPVMATVVERRTSLAMAATSPETARPTAQPEVTNTPEPQWRWTRLTTVPPMTTATTIPDRRRTGHESRDVWEKWRVLTRFEYRGDEGRHRVFELRVRLDPAQKDTPIRCDGKVRLSASGRGRRLDFAHSRDRRRRQSEDLWVLHSLRNKPLRQLEIDASLPSNNAGDDVLVEVGVSEVPDLRSYL